MRSILRLIFPFAALSFLIVPFGQADAALCEPPTANRAALVIGNNAYQHGNKLERAVAGARAVGEAMGKIGFDVTTATDVARADMLKAIEALAGKVRRGDAAFVFFAGRGVNFAGTDYLLPTDASIASVDEIKQGGVRIDEIVEALHRRGAGCIVLVVDASRGDPIKEATAAAAKAPLAKGARPVPPKTIVTPKGPVAHGLSVTGNWKDTFAVFSAGFGQVALEKTPSADNDPHSLFTRSFLKSIGKPGQPFNDAIFEIREAVAALAIKANVVQTPALYDTLRGTIVLAPAAR